MESEQELEPSSTPKLPLFSIPPPPTTMKSPERSGMVTPPLHTSASVPFRWEEEPGKPLPCTALVKAAAAAAATPKNSGPKRLELPPRLQLLDQSKITKMPSPTTVLGGPCNNNVGISVLQSSSMRLKRERQGSFCSSIGSPDQGGQFAEMVLTKERGGFLGSWAGKKTSALLKKGNKKKDVGEGSFVFSSSSWDLAGFAGDGNGGSARVQMSRIRRDRSISGLSQAKSHFWAAVYEGFKQVLPWSKKSKKEGLII